jgi:hypothetical protein
LKIDFILYIKQRQKIQKVAFWTVFKRKTHKTMQKLSQKADFRIKKRPKNGPKPTKMIKF